MRINEILLLGLKHRVTAISRSDGRELWSTELTSGMGNGFVTLLCDGSLVFAYAAGHLDCLKLANGEILWTNELRGYGFGLASLCLPDGKSVPDPAAVQTIVDSEAAAATTSTAASS